MTIGSIIFGIICLCVGGLIGWFTTHIYYKKSLKASGKSNQELLQQIQNIYQLYQKLNNNLEILLQEAKNNNNKEKVIMVKDKFLEISTNLMDSGAFFNRPYGHWAKEIYKRHDESTQIALKKVKKIFDPNNVLNPGVLCFDNLNLKKEDI